MSKIELSREQALLKRRIDKIINDQNDANTSYRDNLQEKGVDSAILVPVFEYFLGFDPIDDISYEVTSSQVNGQRFDFLLDGKFVVESKAFGMTFTNEIVDQICNYIAANDTINYGLLSNGWTFSFFIQRSFIEKHYNNGEQLPGHTKSVYPALSIDLDNDKFIEIISLFQKSIYHESFINIASYVYRQLVKVQGRTSPIHSNKDIDEKIKKMIIESVDFRRGFYFSDIENKKVSPGDRFEYNDGNVKIPIVVLPDGTIKIEKNTATIGDLNKVINENTFKPLISLVTDEWHREDQLFIDPLDIIKQATGMQKPHRKNYPFSRV